MVRFVQDSIAYVVGRQKQNADKNGRLNVNSFVEGDLGLLSTVNLSRHVVTNVGSSKILPQYIGPFRVLRRQGNAYTIELPHVIRTYPTFYVVLSARTVSMSPLPTMEIASTFKISTRMLALALQTFSLVA